MKKTLLFLLTFCFFNAQFIFHAHAASNVWEGRPLPDFNLADQSGQPKTKKDYADRWLILYFYPKDHTPGCTVEAKNFTEDYAKYQAIETSIVGVSYDDVETHKDFAEVYGMQFDLLADVDWVFSKAMNVDRIFPLPHASRQTFVVNPQGIIVKHYPDVTPKSHSQELLKSLELLQENKEVSQ